MAILFSTDSSRLQLHGYRSDYQFPVTVSVGVLAAESVEKSVYADQVMMEAEATVDRTKKADRNRVEYPIASIEPSVPKAHEGPSTD